VQLVEVGVLWEGVGGAGVAPQLVHQRVVCARDGAVVVAVLFKLLEVFYHGDCSTLQVVDTVLQCSFPIGIVTGAKSWLAGVLPEVPGDLEGPTIVAPLVGAADVFIAACGGLADAAQAVLGLAVYSGNCQGDDGDRNK